MMRTGRKGGAAGQERGNGRAQEEAEVEAVEVERQRREESPRCYLSPNVETRWCLARYL